MVVLDHHKVLEGNSGGNNGPLESLRKPSSMLAFGAVNSTAAGAMLQRNAVLNTPALQSPYIQPLPADSEYDSKVSPLAMLTRACNKIEYDMMTANGTSPSSSHKGTPKNQTSTSKDFLEGSNSQRTKTSIHSPHSSHSIKSCSPPLKSSGSTTSTKPSTSPLGAIPSQRIQSPHNGKTTPKRSAVTPKESSFPQSSHSSIPTSTLPSVIPPNSVSPYASLTSPHTMPNMSMIAELAASNPCSDPLCRDSTCPTTVLRNAHQYASLMAAAGSTRHPPYMYSPGGVPSLTNNGLPPLVPNPNQDTQPSFVCNWMSGSDFCGKRFPSGEELMNHLRVHTSSSSSVGNSTAASNSNLTKSNSQTDNDSSLSRLQAAQIQALYPHLSPSTGSASTSALAALQMQAARSLSKSPLSHPTTTSSPPLLPQASKSPFDSAMASAVAMASAMQAAQASASAQAAASSRYHPYGRGPAPMIPTSIMGGLGAPTPQFPPGLSFPSSYFPSAYPPFLQSPYGLPLI